MPSSFHQGQKIRCRGEEWQVLSTTTHELKTANGVTKIIWEVEAEALSGLVKGERYIFLDDLDEIELIDPSEIKPVIDTSYKARKTRTYLEAHLRRLLPRNGAIYLGKHGAFEELNYQLKPAAKALDMIRPRILIGDAVGLGKTIECGILLSELIRRGKVRRILAAVPKAILEQFQMEMWGRFAIPFHRLDSKGLERLRQDLPSTKNPFYHYDKAIISVDTLKLKKYQKLLEECNWDALIIDECHNVADRTDGTGGSARHRVAKRLAQNSRSVVLMSATPHDGTKYGFASLVKLLDRTLIPSDENYSSENIEPIFIRRTRTSLKNELGEKKFGGKKPRIEKLEKVQLTPQEINLLQELHDVEIRSTTLSGKIRRGTRELFKTTLIKSFLSSPEALKETVSKKIKELNKKHKKLEKETKSFRNSDSENDKVLQAMENILVSINRLKGKFSRMEHLKEFLKNEPITNDNKLIIFTERIATMKIVSEFLLKNKFVDDKYDPKTEKQMKGNLLATAHGSDTDIDLNKVVKAFQSNSSGLNILVTTNVSSEGLNLHKNCHRLIHFDLPWSLITLEQRNGRIDRLSQPKQPKIFYFASNATNDYATKEVKDPKSLKDDFWIIEKIERRMNQAAEDMDEEARKRFTSGEDEELENTAKYERQELELNKTHENPLFLLQQYNQSNLNQKPLKLETLPTLFETSPKDFVETLAKEADLKLGKIRNSEITLEFNKKLEYEISEHWPREFKPTENKLVFEADKDQMEAHYNTRLNSQKALDKTFMNEIHPAINLLEHTALGLYPGQEVPVVRIEGNPGSIYFLLQGTLYNKMNESVFQSWEVIEFQKGNSQCEKFVDLNEPDHTKEITNLVRAALDNELGAKELNPFEIRRIQLLTQPALDWMKKLVLEARKKRSEQERPRLKEELDRIHTWQNQRKIFLNEIIENKNKANHAGLFALNAKAKEELLTLDRDAENFKDYIRKCLSTEANPDIRILAIFTTAE